MGIKSTAPPAVVAEQCVAAPSRVLSNEEQVGQERRRMV